MAGESGAEDSIDEFVSDLRQLWESTGKIKFVAIARHVAISKTSLNDAVTRRDRVPSHDVVAALVGFLASSEQQSWLVRRARLEDQVRRERTRPKTPPPRPAIERLAEDRTFEQRETGGTPWVVLGGVLLSLVVGYVLGRSSLPNVEPVRDGMLPTVADGADPVAAGCVADANSVAAQSVEGVATVRLIFSTRCNAFWAKVERLDGAPERGKIDAMTYLRSDDSRRQVAEDVGVASSYTFLLVRRDPSDPICASATIWTDARASHLVGPVC